jgi:hypothetical protein
MESEASGAAGSVGGAAVAAGVLWYAPPPLGPGNPLPVEPPPVEPPIIIEGTGSTVSGPEAIEAVGVGGAAVEGTIAAESAVVASEAGSMLSLFTGFGSSIGMSAVPAALAA